MLLTTVLLVGLVGLSIWVMLYIAHSATILWRPPGIAESDWNEAMRQYAFAPTMLWVTLPICMIAMALSGKIAILVVPLLLPIYSTWLRLKLTSVALRPRREELVNAMIRLVFAWMLGVFAALLLISPLLCAGSAKR